MLSIAIVEDEKDAAEHLQKYIKKYEHVSGEDYQCSWFSDARQFLDDYQPVYDIIFMDIRMPYIDGMKAAEKIREQDEETALIFVTNMAQYAIRGYEVRAMDFILKPLKYFDFEMKFKRALKYINRRQDVVMTIETKEMIKKIPSRDIYYVEVMNHHLLYHMADRTYETYGQLKNVEEILLPFGFAKSSQSYLVNLRYVREIHAAEILVGEDKIPLSRRKRKEFMQIFTEYIGGGI